MMLEREDESQGIAISKACSIMPKLQTCSYVTPINAYSNNLKLGFSVKDVQMGPGFLGHVETAAALGGGCETLHGPLIYKNRRTPILTPPCSKILKSLQI
jgi:hypothetical protein